MIFLKKRISVRKWIKTFLLGLCIYIIFILGFNTLIDPFGKSELICENKYKPIVNERGYKYDYIFKEGNIKNYDSLILGSSRVMQLIPSHSQYTKGFYNFGVSVANNAEKLFILKEWLKNKPLKKVYLGIDYYNFLIDTRPGYVNYYKFYGFSKNYFSFSTFLITLKTISNSIKNKPEVFIEKDGALNYYSKNKEIEEGLFDFSTKKLVEDAIPNYNKFSNFEVQESVFETLKEIEKLSHEYKFELYVFTTPMYYEAFQLYQKNETIYKKFLYINEQLKNIFGRVYFFDGDINLTSNNINYYDSVHYRPILGDKIILRLNSESAFGKLLIKDN
ncbi:hypothetical protein [Halarcobacter ebronensis]|nr:hypothetical protein [Halarcobacter ebronensis]